MSAQGNSTEVPAQLRQRSVGHCPAIRLRPCRSLPTPPVEPSLRGEFHRNHQDTINDLQSLTRSERRELARRFAISAGDVVIDGGAFIGFGGFKYSRLVGSKGRVIAFEADPDNQDLFDQNMDENHVSNVTLIRRALWKTVGTMSLNQAGR